MGQISCWPLLYDRLMYADNLRMSEYSKSSPDSRKMYLLSGWIDIFLISMPRKKITYENGIAIYQNWKFLNIRNQRLILEQSVVWMKIFFLIAMPSEKIIYENGIANGNQRVILEQSAVWMELFFLHLCQQKRFNTLSMRHNGFYDG